MPYSSRSSSMRSSRGPDAAICAIAKSPPRSSPRIIASAMLPAPMKPMVLSIDMFSPRSSVLGPRFSFCPQLYDRFGDGLGHSPIPLTRVVSGSHSFHTFLPRNDQHTRRRIDDRELLPEHVDQRLPRIGLAAKLRGQVLLQREINQEERFTCDVCVILETLEDRHRDLDPFAL